MPGGRGEMVFDQTQQQTGEEQTRARALSLKRLRPPTEVPGYEPKRFLGAGAYGEVWVAVDTNTGRQVAIKFYAHRGGLDWALLSREVEKLVFLSADRYVVQLLDVGWDAEPPYYVMEYLEHGSLEDLLRRERPTRSRSGRRTVSGRGRWAAARARQGRVALRPEAGQRVARPGLAAAAGRLWAIATFARADAGAGNAFFHGSRAGRSDGHSRRPLGRVCVGGVVLFDADRCASPSQRNGGDGNRVGDAPGRPAGPLSPPDRNGAATLAASPVAGSRSGTWPRLSIDAWRRIATSVLQTSRPCSMR